MQRLVLLIAVSLATGLTPAAGQRPARYAPCRTTAQADTTWPSFSFIGLRLTLRLPAELRPVSQSSLGRLARRTQAKEIPGSAADTIQLVAAWEAPGRAIGEIRQVLLFIIRPDVLPAGRPCSFEIRGEPGLIYRKALSAGGQGADEHWVEAYWPGYVIAVGGRTFGAYDAAFGILRGIGVTP